MTANELPQSEVPIVPPRILLGPGPSTAHPRVLQAMMTPMIGYLDPDFVKIMDEVSELLRRVFETEDGLTLSVSGTGSAGMEVGINSLLEPGDTVIMCVCGFFGHRMEDMAERIGANVVVLESEWGKPFPAEMLESELRKHERVKLVTIVHAETSTGVLQPLREVSALAKEHDALFMVDAVTSLGANRVEFDDVGMDYCYSASQKCLATPPGMAPVAASQRALEAVSSRRQKPTSWYLDLGLIANYWGPEHVYHHTAPVSNIVGLREALRIVLEEGLDERAARHRRNAQALRKGLEALGLDSSWSTRSTAWTRSRPCGSRTAWTTWRSGRSYCAGLTIEIGRACLGDFAGRVWRIGLMGESSRAHNVLAFLSAMEEILPGVGYEVAQGAGVAAASKSLATG